MKTTALAFVHLVRIHDTVHSILWLFQHINSTCDSTVATYNNIVPQLSTKINCITVAMNTQIHGHSKSERSQKLTSSNLRLQIVFVKRTDCLRFKYERIVPVVNILALVERVKSIMQKKKDSAVFCYDNIRSCNDQRQ